jgi:6-phosphogluconolactonase
LDSIKIIARGAFVKKAVLSIVFACMLAGPAAAAEFTVYIGSYTDSPPTSTSKGIYAAQFNSDGGALKAIGLAAATVNPAYLSGTPDGRFLYAVNWQTAAIKKGGLDTVSAYSIDRKTWKLHLLNVASAGGALPNQAMVDPSGKVLIVANYGAHAKGQRNAGVAALKIERDGKLAEPFYIDIHPNEPIAKPRPGPYSNLDAHTHGIAFSKDNKFVFIADLGLDRLYTYAFDAAAPSMKPAAPPFIHVDPNSGPRRMLVSPNGKFLYCNYQDSSKVGAFRIENGKLTRIQELSTVPADYKGRNATAEIAIDHSGRHLYVSNRGDDSIAIYDVNPDTGMMTWVESVSAGGKSPRNITFDPTGKYLFVANQASNDVVVFAVNPQTGHLTQTADKLDVPQAGGMFFVKRGS